MLQAAERAPHLLLPLESGDRAAKEQAIESLYWMARGIANQQPPQQAATAAAQPQPGQHPLASRLAATVAPVTNGGPQGGDPRALQWGPGLKSRERARSRSGVGCGLRDRFASGTDLPGEGEPPARPAEGPSGCELVKVQGFLDQRAIPVSGTRTSPLADLDDDSLSRIIDLDRVGQPANSLPARRPRRSEIDDHGPIRPDEQHLAECLLQADSLHRREIAKEHGILEPVAERLGHPDRLPQADGVSHVVAEEVAPTH